MPAIAMPLLTKSPHFQQQLIDVNMVDPPPANIVCPFSSYESLQSDGGSLLSASSRQVSMTSLDKSPSAGKRKKRKFSRDKSVTFATCVKVYRQESIDEAEIKGKWMQRHEYASIRERIKTTLQVVRYSHENNLKVVEHDYLCIRGLEKQILVFVFRVDQRRWRKITNRVVEYQKQQRRVGIEDQEILRSFSMLLSEDSRRCALTRAVRDSNE